MSELFFPGGISPFRCYEGMEVFGTTTFPSFCGCKAEEWNKSRGKVEFFVLFINESSLAERGGEKLEKNPAD